MSAVKASTKKLETLFETLTKEASFCRSFLVIGQVLVKQGKENPASLNIAPRFFALTYMAHVEMVFIRVAKLFDKSANAATIYALLDEARKMKGAFKNKKAPEVQAIIHDADAKIAGLGDVLKRLRVVRNHRVAHLDAKTVLQPKPQSEEARVTIDELFRILDTASAILIQASRSLQRVGRLTV